MTRRTAIARARRGAALLDTKLPNWRRKIKRDRLDMARGYFDPTNESSCGCILAQVDAGRKVPGNFDVLAERLGIQPWSRSGGIAHGFVARGGADEYDALTDGWLTVLKEGK